MRTSKLMQRSGREWIITQKEETNPLICGEGSARQQALKWEKVSVRDLFTQAEKHLRDRLVYYVKAEEICPQEAAVECMKGVTVALTLMSLQQELKGRESVWINRGFNNLAYFGREAISLDPPECEEASGSGSDHGDDDFPGNIH